VLTKGPLSFSSIADSVSRHSKHSYCKEFADLSDLILTVRTTKRLLVALSPLRENVKRGSLTFAT